MKVLLYLENQSSLSVSGIGRALVHQQEALKENGIEFTLNPKDDFDIVHINSYGPKSYHLLKKCKKKGIPVVVHGHSTHEDFRESFRCWKLMAPFYNHMMNRMYKRADLIVTPTPYSKELIENYKGVNCKVVAISNGIKLEDYQYNKKNVEAFKKMFNITNEKVVIGVGFYFKRKGIDDFFDVARKMPDVKFIWFGYLNKFLTTSYILKCIKHKPDNVILPGYIKGNVIKGALYYANCMFFPTNEETEGIVALEALATKLTLVTRDIGVYKGWLQNEVNCFKGKNNEEFIDYIKKSIETDCSSIHEEGYKVVENRTLDKVGLQLKNEYKLLLKK